MHEIKLEQTKLLFLDQSFNSLLQMKKGNVLYIIR